MINRGKGGEDAPEMMKRLQTEVIDARPDMVIWHWKDARLQPMQQVQETQDKNFSFLAAYRPADRKFIRLGDEDVRQVNATADYKFAMGSDAVFTMFGQNTRELAWFVKAGMSPAEALRTATANAAELLGMPDQLGAIAPGYLADIVAVEGDPLSDIQVVIDKVRWVMKGGQVVVDNRK